METRATLTRRLSRATSQVPGPVAVVDLDRFDANAPDGPPVQVCIDVDASLRARLGLLTLHAGVRRSPLHDPDDVARLAARIATTPGLHLRGLMTYEAQSAGIPDRSLAVRAMRASTRELLRDVPTSWPPYATPSVHLVRGDQVADVVPTYRGERRAFA